MIRSSAVIHFAQVKVGCFVCTQSSGFSHQRQKLTTGCIPLLSPFSFHLFLLVYFGSDLASTPADSFGSCYLLFGFFVLLRIGFPQRSNGHKGLFHFIQ